MKKLVNVLLTLAVVLGLSLMPAVASAATTTLIATGTPGTEDRITVEVPNGTILGDIDSISWDEYLVQGYPPHVDIILDLGGGSTDALVFEYAYNNATHYGEAHISTEAFGAQTGTWYDTFNDDGNGPSAVTDTSFAWLTTGASGPYPPDGTTMFGGTLAEWKAGTVTGATHIDANTTVLRLEIEVDNWIKDTRAYVKNIQFNGSQVGNTAVGLTAETSNITAINVGPTGIDFGSVNPGSPIPGNNITVENIGGVTVDVDAYLDPLNGTVFNYLRLKGAYSPGYSGLWDNIISGLKPSLNQTLTTVLDVPSTYNGQGTETAALVFEATAV